jgi:UDP-N-acetyl-D-galactosamine dehydrogenase
LEQNKIPAESEVNKSSASPAHENHEKIAVIGLGYVGFPLAISLAEKYRGVVGFDISEHRITTLRAGSDFTREIDDGRMATSSLHLTGDAGDLADTTFYIVTVPTPISASKRPDLGPLRSACAIIGEHLSRGDAVVFESTVYPGVTEDICGPLLEAASGLKAGVDFNLGYSPERVNPGDKNNTLEKIVKNVSGDTPETLKRIAAIYRNIITAGIYEVSSIKVAEASKVIENTQRDINIALMNELALICNRIGIPTMEVINAASTKWNFIPFTPGMVGGHCIGVDPYYLAALSEELGHHPEVMLSGRRVNDGMTSHIASVILKKLALRDHSIRQSRIGVFGISFKENVPDIRNSKAIELINQLKSFGLTIMVNDPHVSQADAALEGIDLLAESDMKNLDLAVVIAPHREYMDNPGFLECLGTDGVLIDVKSVFRNRSLPAASEYWSL